MRPVRASGSQCAYLARFPMTLPRDTRDITPPEPRDENKKSDRNFGDYREKRCSQRSSACYCVVVMPFTPRRSLYVVALTIGFLSLSEAQLQTPKAATNPLRKFAPDGRKHIGLPSRPPIVRAAVQRAIVTLAGNSRTIKHFDSSGRLRFLGGFTSASYSGDPGERCACPFSPCSQVFWIAARLLSRPS